MEYERRARRPFRRDRGCAGPEPRRMRSDPVAVEERRQNQSGRGPAGPNAPTRGKDRGGAESSRNPEGPQGRRGRGAGYQGQVRPRSRPHSEIPGDRRRGFQRRGDAVRNREQPGAPGQGRASRLEGGGSQVREKRAGDCCGVVRPPAQGGNSQAGREIKQKPAPRTRTRRQCSQRSIRSTGNYTKPSRFSGFNFVRIHGFIFEQEDLVFYRGGKEACVPMTILPGWHSLESTANWYWGFHVAALVFIFLLALTEILAFVYSVRADTLIAIRDSGL